MQKWKGFLLFGFWLTSVAYANQTDPVKQAWNAVNNKDFSEAISILRSSLESSPLDYESKFLLARVYAWNQQTEQGIALLDELLLITPLNVDLLLSKATFLSWQKKSTKALSIARKAREINPNYQDVWKLELKLLKHSQKEPRQHEFAELSDQYITKFNDKAYIQSLTSTKPIYKNTQQLGVFTAYDTLSNDSPDWKYFGLSYIHKSKNWLYTAKMDHFEKFDLQDQQISLEYLWKNVYQNQFTSYVSFSTQDKLLPTWSLGLQANRQLGKTGNAEIGYKHSRYATLNADIIRIAYSEVFQKFEPKFHFINTVFNNKEFALGYILQVSYFYSDYTLGRISVSQNTEAEYSDNNHSYYDVKTISLDGRTRLTKNWDLTLAISHHQQGKVYNKNGIHTGILYKF